MFKDDLQFGLEKENVVSDLLDKYFIVKQSVGYDKEKDLEIYGIIEIKYDRKTIKTGNIALEVRCNNKLSGLSTTKATSWVICCDYGCWLCPVKELKILAKTYGTHKYWWDNLVKGGDNNSSEMALVPFKEIEKFIKIK